MKSQEEYVAALPMVPTVGSMTISSGKRAFTLNLADLHKSQGKRGRRGNLWARAFSGCVLDVG